MRPREACEDDVDLILRGAGDQQDELVAAEPRQQVARPQQRSPDAGEVDEQAVTGSMAAAVVDELEVVEVDDRKRERFAASTGHRTLPRRGDGEPGPIEQAGEGVGVRVGPQTRVEAGEEATATQTIVEKVIQTETSVGARADRRLSPSAAIMSAAYRRAARGRKKNAT